MCSIHVLVRLTCTQCDSVDQFPGMHAVIRELQGPRVEARGYPGTRTCPQAVTVATSRMN